MLLTIDAGNTQIKCALFAASAQAPAHRWRVPTDARVTSDALETAFARELLQTGVERRDVTAVAVASVVPSIDDALAATCRRMFDAEPSFLQADRQRLIAVRTEHPEHAGADLIAAAIGARALRGAPLILVSYGTATVFMAISPAGDYVGAAIAPGIGISIEALFARTAKLQPVAFDDPGHALGTTTEQALQAGIVYGFVGQTRALVDRFRAEMGCAANVVATGGLATAMAAHAPIISAVEPDAAAIGLRLFSESQRRPG